MVEEVHGNENYLSIFKKKLLCTTSACKIGGVCKTSRKGYIKTLRFYYQ